jgi:major outer membrane protein
MRRGFATLLFLSILGSTASTAFGQYPYPYAPPVYGPMPYGPPPMMMQQPYYPPPPMYQMAPPPPPRPTVYVYGPLTEPARPMTSRPVAATDAGQMLPSTDEATRPKPSVTPAQNTTPAQEPIEAPSLSKMLGLDACGPFGCPDDDCDRPGRAPPVHGHGRFIGEVGVYFLAPFVSNRTAFTSTSGTISGNTDFPRVVDFGPRASLGYLFHSGWGFRANYWYLHGAANQSVQNSDPTSVIATPLAAPFQLSSPSATLAQGLGADQFNFAQRLDINVADAEILKECQVFDATFLFSVGARYARILQTYSASRNNTGGANGAGTVNVDNESVTSGSRFEGWGPTTSLEFIHRLGRTNVSFYASGRASFLYGIDHFDQNVASQRNSVSPTGTPTFASTANSSVNKDSRMMTIVEAEIGLQYGCCIHNCYVFFRAGGVYQRWFDVGSPISASGDLSFVGGTARVGIVY